MTPGPPAPWPTRPAPRPRPGLPWLAFPARTPRPAHSWAEPVIVAVQRWREARKLGDDHRRPDGHQRTSAMITGPDGRQSRQPRCPGASRRVRWPAQPTKRRVIPTDPPPRARAGTRRRNPAQPTPPLVAASSPKPGTAPNPPIQDQPGHRTDPLRMLTGRAPPVDTPPWREGASHHRLAATASPPPGISGPQLTEAAAGHEQISAAGSPHGRPRPQPGPFAAVICKAGWPRAKERIIG